MPPPATPAAELENVASAPCAGLPASRTGHRGQPIRRHSAAACKTARTVTFVAVMSRARRLVLAWVVTSAGRDVPGGLRTDAPD
jgi:hypothetical protein